MDKFEVTIVYDKDMGGQTKKTSESYLFESESHGDAENRCIEEVSAFISGDFVVSDVKRKRIAEVFDTKKENFYTASVAFIVLDEKTGQEKRKSMTYLVSGDTLYEAYKTLKEEMDKGMADYEVNGITKSRILDYYKAV